MSNIHVPRLQTGTFTLLENEMAAFEVSKHRTYFAAQDDEQFNGLIWIGTGPSTNLTEWFSFGSSAGVDTYILSRGVFGPIYISQDGPLGGQITYLSNLLETIQILPIPT